MSNQLYLATQAASDDLLVHVEISTIVRRIRLCAGGRELISAKLDESACLRAETDEHTIWLRPRSWPWRRPRLLLDGEEVPMSWVRSRRVLRRHLAAHEPAAPRSRWGETAALLSWKFVKVAFFLTIGWISLLAVIGLFALLFR